MRQTARRVMLTTAAAGGVLGAAVFVIAVWCERGPGQEREIDRLAAVADVRSGANVADIGAGAGRMAARVAHRVAPAGRVYATEIRPALLATIARNAAALGAANLTAVSAGEQTTGLAAGCCDVVYMRRVYHHLTDTGSINRSVYAALRPGGRFVVIEFESPRWLPLWRHGVGMDRVRREVTRAGFVLDKAIDRWSPVDYCLVFRKLAPPQRV